MQQVKVSVWWNLQQGGRFLHPPPSALKIESGRLGNLLGSHGLWRGGSGHLHTKQILKSEFLLRAHEVLMCLRQSFKLSWKSILARVTLVMCIVVHIKCLSNFQCIMDEHDDAYPDA